MNNNYNKMKNRDSFKKIINQIKNLINQFKILIRLISFDNNFFWLLKIHFEF
jgi:hypothetical protein